jgi:septal ring factor EnvC (AmiA/AmiB activator)
MRAGFILNTLLALLLPILALANQDDPSSELQERIDEINLQITSEAESLARIQQRIDEVEGQLKLLKEEAQKLRVEERDLLYRLDKVTAEKTRLEQELQELDIERRRIEEVSIRRLRASYMHPPAHALADLLRSSQSSTFSHMGLYLANVRSFDRRTIDGLIELRRSRAEKAAELELATTNRQLVVQKVKAKRNAIIKQVASQEPLAKQLKGQGAEREEIVTQLKAQLLRFETVLAGLTGGEEDEVTASRARMRRAKQPQSKISPYDGDGLGRSRGKLPRPVQGQVVVGFGKKVTTKTGVAGESKGLEFAAPVGESVRAVAPGKVMFYGRMPVLGTILIIDHGERYYSLYGRLEGVTVERGVEVTEGQVLGNPGEPEPDGRNFYFEIRKNGNPVNPEPFLRVKA